MRGKAENVPAASSTLKENTSVGGRRKKQRKKTGVLGQKERRVEETESNRRSFPISQHTQLEESLLERCCFSPPLPPPHTDLLPQ